MPTTPALTEREEERAKTALIQMGNLLAVAQQMDPESLRLASVSGGMLPEYLEQIQVTFQFLKMPKGDKPRD
jgi:hypothetical protein